MRVFVPLGNNLSLSSDSEDSSSGSSSSSSSSSDESSSLSSCSSHDSSLSFSAEENAEDWVSAAGEGDAVKIKKTACEKEIPLLILAKDPETFKEENQELEVETKIKEAPTLQLAPPSSIEDQPPLPSQDLSAPEKPLAAKEIDYSPRRNKKRPAVCFEEKKPVDNVSAVSLGGVEAEQAVEAVAPKRPRPDSKPPAKPTPTKDVKKMAVGGRCKADESSDDEVEVRDYWVQPAENEPPVLQNNPAVAAASYPDPAAEDDEQDPFLQGGVAVASHVAVKEAADGSLSKFREILKNQGLEMIEQEGDGNCLFRAVSLQVYGQSDNHAEVRERCLDFMSRNEEHYSNFVAVGASDDEDSSLVATTSTSNPQNAFQAYIARKRVLGVHGNHAEIQAISELFNRPVEVYAPDDKGNGKPMNIFHAEYKTSDPPIRLSYHDGNHYNAIIDPLVPTAGLGLGLPGLQPGLADKMQVAKAKTESDHLADEMELERVMKESREEFAGAEEDELQRVLKESAYSMDYMYKNKALALSDLDETNYELEQKVLASSMESYIRQEHGRKQRASPVDRARRRSSPPAASFPSPPHEQPAAAAASASMYATIPPAAAAGRRRRNSPNHFSPPEPLQPSSYASSSSYAAAVPPVASASVAAAAPTVASTAAAAASKSSAEEYPQTVQELVMNGFDHRKVVHAYELIGDNFDDLLSFLLSSGN